MTQAADQVNLQPWLSLVEKRELRVGIIGLGYVGLPLVLLFSQEGFRVFLAALGITPLIVDFERLAVV